MSIFCQRFLFTATEGPPNKSSLYRKIALLKQQRKVNNAQPELNLNAKNFVRIPTKTGFLAESGFSGNSEMALV